MSFPFAYCPHGDEVIQRLRGLFEQRDPERILAVMEIPSQTLARFAATHTGGYCDYPDPGERMRFWDACLSERAGVLDDSIPSAYLSELDQGLYGGLLGGDVRFLCDPATGWISSMVPPLLRDWSEFEVREFQPDRGWQQRYVDQLKAFVTAARGKFGISHFILISGLNFVFELVGATETYLALGDRPESIRRAIDLGYELNVSVQQTFFDHVPLLEGGTCSNMVQWIPGRIVSESVDPFHMTSVACFAQWGRANVERIFARFDGGVIHLHANGRHLLEAVTAIAGLKAISLMDDRGFETAFEFLPRARLRTGNLPLIVNVEFEAFRAALTRNALPGGVLYRVKCVPDMATANRCMDEVRNYRATVR